MTNVISELTLSKIAELSYESESIFREKINTYIENKLLEMPINICFFNACETTSIDAQIYSIQYSDKIIFSVRGTSSKKDFLSDLYVFKKKFSDVNVSTQKNIKNMKVHSGFLEQYNSLKFFTISNIFKIIWNQSHNKTEDQSIKIIFTSHSLGAAVSILLSTLLKSHFGSKIYIINYLFGCPKVGNKIFVDYYNNIIDETYRYVNQNDIIPRIPKINYKTTKNRIILGDPKNVNFFTRFLGSINDHPIKQYINRLDTLENLEFFMKGEKLQKDKNVKHIDIDIPNNIDKTLII